jgi:hypothetical protein
MTRRFVVHMVLKVSPSRRLGDAKASERSGTSRRRARFRQESKASVLTWGIQSVA